MEPFFAMVSSRCICSIRIRSASSETSTLVIFRLSCFSASIPSPPFPSSSIPVSFRHFPPPIRLFPSCQPTSPCVILSLSGSSRSSSSIVHPYNTANCGSLSALGNTDPVSHIDIVDCRTPRLFAAMLCVNPAFKRRACIDFTMRTPQISSTLIFYISHNDKSSEISIFYQHS